MSQTESLSHEKSLLFNFFSRWLDLSTKSDDDRICFPNNLLQDAANKFRHAFPCRNFSLPAQKCASSRIALVRQQIDSITTGSHKKIGRVNLGQRFQVKFTSSQSVNESIAFHISELVMCDLIYDRCSMHACKVCTVLCELCGEIWSKLMLLSC